MIYDLAYFFVTFNLIDIVTFEVGNIDSRLFGTVEFFIASGGHIWSFGTVSFIQMIFFSLNFIRWSFVLAIS